MARKARYEIKHYETSYNIINIPTYFSFEFVNTFLKSRGYTIVPIEQIDDDDRYMETSIEKKLCAVKSGENPDLDINEIINVFSKEYQEVLLSLLINARDINYYEQLIKEQSK